MFHSVEDAKNHAAACAGLPNAGAFQAVPGLQVAGIDAILLDDPGTSEEIKKSIRDRLEVQQGFEFVNEKGVKCQIVIGPFREGFDLWFVNPENGAAFRI
jgi:hypothetical protein